MASETVRTFSRFFSKSRKHDFLHFFETFHTFCRTQTDRRTALQTVGTLSSVYRNGQRVESSLEI